MAKKNNDFKYPVHLEGEYFAEGYYYRIEDSKNNFICYCLTESDAKAMVELLNNIAN